MASMLLILPYPPSTNVYWRTDRGGRPHLSDDAKAYRAMAKALAYQHMGADALMMGPLELLLNLYRPQASGDVDNFNKQIMDALQGIVYVNDSQIVHLDIWRYDDRANPRAEVTIRHYGPHTESLGLVAAKQPLSTTRRRSKI